MTYKCIETNTNMSQEKCQNEKIYNSWSSSWHRSIINLEELLRVLYNLCRWSDMYLNCFNVNNVKLTHRIIAIKSEKDQNYYVFIFNVKCSLFICLLIYSHLFLFPNWSTKNNTACLKRKKWINKIETKFGRRDIS